MTNENKETLEVLGHHSKKYSEKERSILDDLGKVFDDSQLRLAQKLQTFPRHVRRQDIARFLTKYEIFKISLPANGSIVECGVFSGFPDVHEKDTQRGASEHSHVGAFATNNSIVEEIQSLVDIHDRNRPLGHIPKIEIVAGDACKTIPKYVDDNPQLLISLLYLDFDIYEPTKVALEHLYSRVVKGGVVAFDELNCLEWPGETIALREFLDLSQVSLKRFPSDPYISYFIKGE